jgi:hypothetical protein
MFLQVADYEIQKHKYNLSRREIKKPQMHVSTGS